MRRARAGGASLNLATIRPAALDRKLAAARAAGFAAVGLALDEMMEAGEDGVVEVRLQGLPVSDLVGIRGWMEADRTSRLVGLTRAEQACELAGKVGCPLLVAQPSGEEADALTAARRFAELCRLAGRLGVRVGLEFEGGRRGLATLAQAWEVVELAEADNGGLVVDAFHFYVGGSTVEMLEPVPASKLFLVQLCDAPELPRHELRDRHRLYPGGGVIGLESLLAALRANGYAGYYSLELENERYWEEEPEVVAREGMRALRKLDIG